jgi:cystathionine gamma-synthase
MVIIYIILYLSNLFLSLVLNPQSRHYSALKSQLSETFEDTYFDEDAIYMERNSRDFKHRIKVIDDNTTAVCEFLRSRSTAGGSTSSQTALKNVFYPKYITHVNYDVCRVKPSPSLPSGGGFGGLFSLTFTSTFASKAFFDALQVHKGPSLGTNFTLACPYTILAHFAELDWAEEFGVERGIVRVSVGMEERDKLLDVFENAVKAAEETVGDGL